MAMVAIFPIAIIIVLVFIAIIAILMRRSKRKGGRRLLTLNYRDSRPIYEQIKDGLRKLIVTGALQPDEKLPSVRSMATELAINPNTIQRAYGELEAEGYIYSIPGKGSFAAAVTEPLEIRRMELSAKLKDIVSELRYLNVTLEEVTALIKEGYKND